jgi:hypothetical protein
MPGPRAIGARVLDGQRIRYPDAAEPLGQVAVLQIAQLRQMLAQRRSEHAREQRASVLVVFPSDVRRKLRGLVSLIEKKEGDRLHWLFSILDEIQKRAAA